MDERPIGIFDSGLGGLSALRALERLLPGENLIYFGDSANAPYGTRSLEQLRTLARNNAAFLEGEGVKAILVACGTVSSNAMDLLRSSLSLPVFDVLTAPCLRTAEATGNGTAAVIATEATIRSGAFQKALGEAGGPGLRVFAKPCQSLVSVVEAGHFHRGDAAAEGAVAEELAPVRDLAPDTLLLACTHFPLLEDVIAAYLGPRTRLLSVSELAAEALKETLSQKNLLREGGEGASRFYTSGDPERFAEAAAQLLGRPVRARRRVLTELEP